MTRLIRSNLYQMIHTKAFWIMIIGFAGLIIGTPYINEVSSANTFLLGQASSSEVVCAMIPMFVAFLVGRGYHHRTCMYEVMSGNSPSRILFSKLLGIALPLAILFELLTIIGFGISCTMGYTDLGSLLVRESLFFVVFLRATTMGVLITTCMKSLGSIGIAYVRVLAESFIIMIYEATSGGDFHASAGTDMVTSSGSRILNCLCITAQPGIIASQPLDSTLFLQIFLGFFAELLIWLGLSYIIYKKKDY